MLDFAERSRPRAGGRIGLLRRGALLLRDVGQGRTHLTVTGPAFATAWNSGFASSHFPDHSKRERLPFCASMLPGCSLSTSS